MKMKKIIVSIMVILLCISATFSVFGAFDYGGKMDTMVAGEPGAAGDRIKALAGTAVNVTQVVAVGVAIVMLIVLAIKYMTSAAGDKATIKKHAVTYVTGAIILFASTGILEIIKMFSASFGNAAGGGAEE